jgi:hypothetical protein
MAELPLDLDRKYHFLPASVYHMFDSSFAMLAVLIHCMIMVREGVGRG